MERKRDAFGVVVILVYLVVASIISHNSLKSEQRVAAQKQVLGTRTAVFENNTDLPSLTRLYELSNIERTNRGILPLQIDTTLTVVAQSRADDMVQNKYYAHKNPTGFYYFDLLKNTVFEQNYNCENLAMLSSLSPQAYIQEWLSSSKGHKQCMLHSSTTHVGYGVAKLSAEHTNTAEPTYIIVAIHASPN